MLDLSAFLGLTRRVLGTVPTVLYLHENQLTYPRRAGEALDQGLAWANWRSLVAADQIWCNSAFHRDELVEALPKFLAAVPDHDHVGVLDEVRRRMVVEPVGVDSRRLARIERQSSGGPPLVLSNHRWHHDKDVGAVVRALLRLADEGLEFRAAIVGDDRGGEADVIDPLIDRLGSRVLHRGRLDRDTYERVLSQTDVVVSAARNEFFGIAVAEAVAAGAWPVVPAGLAYPEVIAPQHHGVTLYGPGDLTDRLRSTIQNVGLGHDSIAGLRESMDRFDWAVIAARYDARVDELADSRG